MLGIAAVLYTVTTTRKVTNHSMLRICRGRVAGKHSLYGCCCQIRLSEVKKSVGSVASGHDILVSIDFQGEDDKPGVTDTTRLFASLRVDGVEIYHGVQ